MIAPIEDATAAGSGETAPTTTTNLVLPNLVGTWPVETLPAITRAPDAPATPTPTTAPEDPTTAPSKPRWAPAMTDSGTAFSPARYARIYGESPEGLVQWAELNQTHLGIPGEYNAAVLLQAAGRLTELTIALGLIKAVRPALRAVANGESLGNEEVRAAFLAALDVIDDETAEVDEVQEIATNAKNDDVTTTTTTTTTTETTNETTTASN